MVVAALGRPEISFDAEFLSEAPPDSSDLSVLLFLHSSLHFSLCRGNSGEIQSSNYPISLLSVGYITHHAPFHLTQSPSQSIYHRCLSYLLSCPHSSRVTWNITCSVSSAVSSTEPPLLRARIHFTFPLTAGM